MMDTVVSLDVMISETQRKRDDAEWEDDTRTTTLLEKFLGELYELRDSGSLWYPLF